MGKTFKLRNGGAKGSGQLRHNDAKKRHFGKSKDRFRFDPKKDYSSR